MIRFRTFLAIVTIFGLIVFLISRGPQQEFERTVLPSVSPSDVEAPKFSRDVTATDTDWEGLVDFDEALPEVRPEMAAYYSQGVVHFDNGEYDQAIRAYDEALRCNPGYADAHYAEALTTRIPQSRPSKTSSPPATQALEIAPAGGSETDQRSLAIHLASMRTKDEAETGWNHLQRQFPELIGQRDLIIRSVEIEAQGTFFRIMTGPFEARSRAQDLCDKFEPREQYCMVLRLTDAR